MLRNSVITDLLRSFDLERPRGSRALPTWNLALVLDALRKNPFEPISQIQISHLTVKTMFLLALSSGNRHSELHAIVRQGSGMLGNDSFVLQFDASFSAKTAKGSKRVEGSITIPKLPYSEERTLCPVRALKAYDERLKPLGKENLSLKILPQLQAWLEKGCVTEHCFQMDQERDSMVLPGFRDKF